MVRIGSIIVDFNTSINDKNYKLLLFSCMYLKKIPTTSVIGISLFVTNNLTTKTNLQTHQPNVARSCLRCGLRCGDALQSAPILRL